MKQKMTVMDFRRYKQEGMKFTEIVCYDCMMASIVDESMTEAILVGDSLANVINGLPSTLPVTMDTMIYHISSVRRGAPNTLIIGDMPFGSYNINNEQAVANATRLMKEGGCDCVKLEGGLEVIGQVSAIVKAGIPVVGHIGVMPQTAGASGGFKVRGATKESADKLLEEALALEEAGACCLCLECMPSVVAKRITESLKIPTLGAGAGPYCDGQELNFYDLTGLFNTFKPKYVKRYGELHGDILNMLDRFHEESKDGVFPSPENSYNNQVEGY